VVAGSPNRGTKIKVVSLLGGQDPSSIDFRLQENGAVSGRVLGQSNEPMPGLEVVLIGREYFAGALRYYRRRATATDDRGEYRLQEIPPGTSFLLLARERNTGMSPMSQVPNDPKLRRPAPAPTYYPNSTRPEEGELITLRAGESRENIDIRMLRSPSYCVEGTLRAAGGPADLSFWIHEEEMSFGLGPSGGVTGVPPGGKCGPDGKIRVCGLHPGSYRLTAFTGNLNSPVDFGATLITIADRDLRDVTITPQPRVPLTGRVVWASAPPEKPVNSQLSVLLTPLDRTAGGLGERATSPVPGEFSVKTHSGQDLLMDEYFVRVMGLTDPLYVKDITYGATSVIRSPLKLGGAMTGAELRVIVGHDGGSLAARVADKDGKGVPDVNVILMPKDAASEADLAAMRITGQTDQNGGYSSPTLAPGHYYVLATPSDVTDWSPESIGKLWGARLKAHEAEVGPNATVQVTLEPVVLN